MKKLLQKTAYKTLEILDEQNYSDEDLFNASLIFSHVLFDVLYSVNTEINVKEKKFFAKKCGEDIRNLIEIYTDKDMRKIAKNLIKTNKNIS